MRVALFKDGEIPKVGQEVLEVDLNSVARFKEVPLYVVHVREREVSMAYSRGGTIAVVARGDDLQSFFSKVFRGKDEPCSTRRTSIR